MIFYKNFRITCDYCEHFCLLLLKGNGTSNLRLIIPLSLVSHGQGGSWCGWFLASVSVVFYLEFYYICDYTNSSLVCRPQARLPETLGLLFGVVHGHPDLLRIRYNFALFLSKPSRRQPMICEDNHINSPVQ